MFHVLTKRLRMQILPSAADEAHDRRENIVQTEQETAKGQHERGGNQNENEEGTVEDEANRSTDVFPGVVVKVRMLSCCLHTVS